MDALKKSLDAVTATKKKPAKAAVAQRAQKRKTRVRDTGAEHDGAGPHGQSPSKAATARPGGVHKNGRQPADRPFRSFCATPGGLAYGLP